MANDGKNTVLISVGIARWPLNCAFVEPGSLPSSLNCSDAPDQDGEMASSSDNTSR